MVVHLRRNIFIGFWNGMMAVAPFEYGDICEDGASFEYV
jgi:hypothetical protein